MKWTALVTIASLLMYLALGLNVGRARARYKIAAPAIVGDATFERIFRVHQNTLEQLVLYLPALWLYGWYVSDRGAAALGLVWIAGRILYARGYYADAARRGRGMQIAALAMMALLLGALVGLLRA